MGGVVVGVENTTAVVSGLPYVEFALEAERKVPFDVLHCLFEGASGAEVNNRWTLSGMITKAWS
jgi:hypothetical protein